MTPPAPAPPVHIAWVTSQFSARSTFLARELREMHRRRVAVSIYSLRAPRRDDAQWCRDQVPAFTLRYVPYVLSWDVLLGLPAAVLRRPHRLVRTLAKILRHGSRQPRVLLKTLAVLPKAAALCRMIRRTGATRVHAHWATISSTVGWIAADLAAVPFSFTAHAWDIYTDDCLHREKLRAADCAVVCNEFGRRILVERNGLEHRHKVHLVYHGLDLAEFSPPDPPRRQPGRILAVGQLNRKKGFATLVEACHLLRQRGVEFSCRIVGDPGDATEALEELVRRHGLQDRVVAAGEVAPAEVIPLYRAAAVLAVPTVVTPEGHTDGLPNVVIEAMACGTPVVGSRAAGIPEAIQDGVSGRLVPAGDPEALAGALQDVLAHPGVAAELGREARRQAEQHYDIRRNVGRLLEVLGAIPRDGEAA